MSDLDRALKSLGEPAPANPPAAFLAAVGRRRRQRRVRQFSTAAAALVVVAGAALITNPWRTRPFTPRIEPIAIARPAPDTLRGLTQLNPDLSVDDLQLPVASGGGEDVILQVGMRWEPARVERWVSQ